MEIEENSDSQSSEGDPELDIFPLSEIQAHTDSVCSVAWHPLQAEIYASGGIDDIAFIYKADEVKELTGHTDSIIAVQFSPCGEYLAISSMDGNTSVFLVSNYELISKFIGPTEEIISLHWHPRVLSLMVLSADLSLWVWHLRKTSPVAIIYGHPLSIAKFAPIGRFIYAGGSDGSFKVWDMKAENFDTNPPYLTISPKEIHTDEVICIDLHETGVGLTGSKDGSVGLVNINSKRVLGKIQVSEESIESVLFCKEMLWFLVGSMSGDLKIYECDTMSPRCQIKIDCGIVRAIWDKFNVFLAGTDGQIQCIDGRTGELLKKYKGCRETILDLDVKQ